nr:uncharacterized protein LOC106827226 [Equus asinus]XP_044631531.1 uncharacterized protein LOC106827226 [Equus asinus]
MPRPHVDHLHTCRVEGSSVWQVQEREVPLPWSRAGCRENKQDSCLLHLQATLEGSTDSQLALTQERLASTHRTKSKASIQPGPRPLPPSVLHRGKAHLALPPLPLSLES